ncbi:type II toxin-antitoxin system RelE/ParE family toxin [Methylobacterium trifolii]
MRRRRRGRTPAGMGSRSLDAVTSPDALKAPPGNRLHPLLHDRAGQHSIWINDQFRLCFRWTAAGPKDVEIVDDH